MAYDGIDGKHHEYFERNTDYEWQPGERRGFDDGYGERGYDPPADDSPERDDYDIRFSNGAYIRMDEEYPGLHDATVALHENGHSSAEDTINWLLASAEDKHRWARAGELDGFEFTSRTVYG